jgi:hypothetical protein
MVKTNPEFWAELSVDHANDMQLPDTAETLPEDVEHDTELEDQDTDDSDLSLDTLITALTRTYLKPLALAKVEIWHHSQMLKMWIWSQKWSCQWNQMMNKGRAVVWVVVVERETRCLISITRDSGSTMTEMTGRMIAYFPPLLAESMGMANVWQHGGISAKVNLFVFLFT